MAHPTRGRPWGGGDEGQKKGLCWTLILGSLFKISVFRRGFGFACLGGWFGFRQIPPLPPHSLHLVSWACRDRGHIPLHPKVRGQVQGSGPSGGVAAGPMCGPCMQAVPADPASYCPPPTHPPHYMHNMHAPSASFCTKCCTSQGIFSIKCHQGPRNFLQMLPSAMHPSVSWRCRTWPVPAALSCVSCIVCCVCVCVRCVCSCGVSA